MPKATFKSPKGSREVCTRPEDLRPALLRAASLSSPLRCESPLVL